MGSTQSRPLPETDRRPCRVGRSSDCTSPAVSCRGRAQRWAALLAAAASLVVVHACSAPKYEYVSNGEFGNYFRMPRSWQMQDITDQLSAGRVGADQGSNVTLWEVLLASPLRVTGTTAPAPNAEVAELLSPNVVGRVMVVDLGPSDTEQVGLSTVRAAFSATGIDPLFPPEDLASDTVEVASYEPLAAGESLTGSRVVANIDVDPSPSSAQWITESQSMLFDNRTGLVYLLSLRCAAECYELNQQQINEIASSFTVKT